MLKIFMASLYDSIYRLKGVSIKPLSLTSSFHPLRGQERKSLPGEMLVEGEGGRDALRAHEREAGTINEGDVFGGKLSEYFKPFIRRLFRNPLDLYAGEILLPEFNRGPVRNLLGDDRE